ncbi:MAG: tRNA uridine-5-carboxymethylaminomethyl(34) synthesis GTPase MnmE [Verrucomicrobia bacterium]|nr:tRNA uridine-5-carboxymethylaminomethyl(34) synthesis GTPase MnmE [Verrucomicrobiota bacterium]NDB74706.1 tRNA uridine-5-carboxymethylaminomethyl(34) synthesis GTPase MnmE [Verrucomicrobiota bacterium]NDD37116.1 tRNA uridine-5-carboxymethylaminomethyl(34) synthesis GTPase MnmE [Verrucomicrobiota bacterium]NDE96986.1 tRNA uridine-5-carboxymethylaminomethyl(34) synthesis GTPase MnmE [Verrucomicrobiota bacterium]
MLSDTIAAIATPLGEGGLAVLRVSGPQALAVADKVFVPVGKSSQKPSAAASHTIHYGRVERDGRFVDEVLVAVLRAPRTFTREDTVEFSCHGGLLPAKLVLDALLAAGARLAAPGEFTQRAFLNGRLDLAQAEAVADLIHARTELALTAAGEQLAGKLSQRINKLRDDLVKTLAHIEAHIDFPDEDIAPDTRGQLLARLERGVAFMDELLRTADEGQILRRGIRAAIIGRPNAGKSSLLNQLLGHDRAIVSPIAGTTRDTIEETANIRGLPVVFVDTAGLRESRDDIEIEGIRRTRAMVAKAELVLHVLDASEPLSAEDEQFLAEFAEKKRLVVLNKCDLPRAGGFQPPLGLLEAQGGDRKSPARAIAVSCLTGAGIEQLKDAIKQSIWSGDINAEMLQVMINSRHQDALQRARAATLRTAEALRMESTLELVAMDLRIAVNAVGEIVGKTTTEDLLDSIFSQFCIGK